MSPSHQSVLSCCHVVDKNAASAYILGQQLALLRYVKDLEAGQESGYETMTNMNRTDKFQYGTVRTGDNCGLVFGFKFIV